MKFLKEFIVSERRCDIGVMFPFGNGLLFSKNIYSRRVKKINSWVLSTQESKKY